MNRLTSAAIAILAAALFLSSCDAMRSLAGRPTSEQIELKRSRIEADRAAEQARADSLARAQKVVTDSLDAQAYLASRNQMFIKRSAMNSLASDLDKAYYMVVGSFKTPGNAERLAAKASEAGYHPVLIKFRSGMTAVAAEASDHIADIAAAVRKAADEGNFQNDAWILLNN